MTLLDDPKKRHPEEEDGEDGPEEEDGEDSSEQDDTEGGDE